MTSWWQARTSDVAMQNLAKELESARNVLFLNTLPVNQSISRGSLGGFGSPAGEFGVSTGSQAFTSVIVHITNRDESGNVASMDRINCESIIMVVQDTFEPSNVNLKWIQKTFGEGHRIKITPVQGKTLTLKTGGNIDIGMDVVINDNQFVELIFTTNSNATASGGWVITGLGGGGGGLSFPILYPEDNLGNRGAETVSIDLGGSTAHYHEMTVTDDIGLAFINPPAADKGLVFYIMIIQDGTGGHEIILTPPALKNGSDMNALLDKAPNSRTLFKIFTGDGGTSYHAELVDLTSGGGSSTLAGLSDVDIVGATNRDILQYDSALAKWKNQQYMLSNGNTATAGMIRSHNNNIVLGLRNFGNNGQYEVKLDVSDRLDITYTRQAPATLVIRSQHDTQPDQNLIISQGSGTGATSLIGIPNSLTLDVGATPGLLVATPSALDIIVDTDMNNKSILNASGLSITDSGGGAKGSVFGTVGNNALRLNAVSATSGYQFNVNSVERAQLTNSSFTVIDALITSLDLGSGESGSLRKTNTTFLFNSSDQYTLQVAGNPKFELTANIAQLKDVSLFISDTVNLKDTEIVQEATRVLFDTPDKYAYLVAGANKMELDASNMLVNDATLQIYDVGSGEAGSLRKTSTEFIINSSDRYFIQVAGNTMLHIDATDIILGQNSGDRVKYNALLDSSIVPATSLAYTLGSSAGLFNAIYSATLIGKSGASSVLRQIEFQGTGTGIDLSIGTNENYRFYVYSGSSYILALQVNIDNIDLADSYMKGVDYVQFNTSLVGSSPSVSNPYILSTTTELAFSAPTGDDFVFYEAGAARFRIENDGTLQWLESGRQHRIAVTANALQLYSELATDSVQLWAGTGASRNVLKVEQAVVTIEHGGAGNSNPIEIRIAQPAPSNATDIGYIRWADEDGSPIYAEIRGTAVDTTLGSADGKMALRIAASGALSTILEMNSSGGALQMGFFGTAAVSRPNVTGSRGGNAALASLLTSLANLGLITDGTSA